MLPRDLIRHTFIHGLSRRACISQALRDAIKWLILDVSRDSTVTASDDEFRVGTPIISEVDGMPLDYQLRAQY